MPSRKMNVLVYSGNGASTQSIRQATTTLHRLLYPNYAIIPLATTTLLKEPWASTCALLVFPGGADLGYCRDLNGAGNRLISQYVRNGGRYLGLCAGGYYGSGKCEFEVGNGELEVVGKRELAFFPGICRGGAFKGYEYASERGAKLVRLKVRRGALGEAKAESPVDIQVNSQARTGLLEEICSYYNGGGVFVDASTMDPDFVEVLADYLAPPLEVDGGSGKAAVVYCKVGKGAAVLTGPHPEFDADELSPQPHLPGYEKLIKELKDGTPERERFLRAVLTKLGLDVNDERVARPALTKLYLAAHYPDEMHELLHAWDDIITRDGDSETIKGQDTFKILRFSADEEDDDDLGSWEGWKEALDEIQPGAGPEKEQGIPAQPIVVAEHRWPPGTLSFDYEAYFGYLKYYRCTTDYMSTDWGDLLMYGDVVTSTNTILEKNQSFLSTLPTGFTLAARTSIAARGRGNNVWVGPPGQLIFSTVINHPSRLFTTRPIVFLQYLAALAIVEAVQTYDPEDKYSIFSGLPVKLKWPNDIYARHPSTPDEPASYVKIGGILSHCSYVAGNYQVVLGIGLNATNQKPTTSLNRLLSPNNSATTSAAPSATPSATASRSHSPLPFKDNSPLNGTAGMAATPSPLSSIPQPPTSFTIERLLARILTRLETTYSRFCRDGFTGDLERRYYAHWLHTDQVVALESAGGVRVRVKGVTSDWGLLEVEELREKFNEGEVDVPTGRKWVLQSDENSFDYWKGLIRAKT